MRGWNSTWWKTVCIPGGVIFVLALILFSAEIIRISPAALSFYYSAVFAGGLLLAWRFHSGRTAAALVLVLLGQRAVEFFTGGHLPLSGPGRTALEAVSFLLALNFVWISLEDEFGFSIAALAPRFGVLFVESVFVAVICRPQPAIGSTLFSGAWLPPAWFAWTKLSQISLLAVVFAFVFLAVRSAVTRKQVDSALAWSLASLAFAFSAGGIGRLSDGFVATAGLVLLVSVVETSYRMAYHDELTGIPSRRAFNDVTANLESPYTLAVVDIDHFKKFNDTYGHDTGDEVLRMVAGRLSQATGGGQAFRVGGEEFSLLFVGKTVTEAVAHLDQLRRTIETTSFSLRGLDRREVARGPERRTGSPNSRRPGKPAQSRTDLTVTVSIGVAGSQPEISFESILGRADKALYRAKENGRNRVEVDGKRTLEESRTVRKKKSSRVKTA